MSSSFFAYLPFSHLLSFQSEDRALLRIPKSFAHLQDLNYLLKKYRDIHPFRVFFSYVLTYFLSVPISVLLLSSF